ISIAGGPVIGGVLIAQGGWRSIFFVTLPLGAAGLAATRLGIDSDDTRAAAASWASSASAASSTSSASSAADGAHHAHPA
ncbi:MFS transporter, partial [Burkholderia pseudomallei]